ncbi:hypothetical protein LXA43DRAFT_1102495 [Ganoderma leucocontextum]|nr:hypothetical protein LXA43DRAFT_1102495 [Ganoderma leucocontextum]
MKALPPEIWALIVKEIEREDQKTCLALSKLHHELSTRALFAHVNVHFGLWIVDPSVTWSEETAAELQLKNNVTWDILRHISLFPDFAKVVKKLIIRAYLPGVGWGEDIFHTRALIAALQALPNLRTFHWHGDSPRLSQDVLTALAQSSGPSLKELHIPITKATAPCLSAFSGLHELRTVDVGWFDSSLDEGCARALQMAVDSMSRTLTRITIAGDVFWGCSIRSMLGLQELEVILPRTAGGLALVFRHCLSLRSLTLFPRALYELFSALQAEPTALPGLRALKFVYSSIEDMPRFEYRHAQTLARFIENKKELASLDVEIDGPTDETPCDIPLLQAIAQLPRLEVLGFSLARSAWEPSDIQFFRERIPRAVTALRISVSVEQADNDVLLQEWFSLIKDLSSLRYLHIFDKFRTFDLKQQILEDPPASLELLGYGPFVRWLVRDHNDLDDDRPKYSPCWPASKVQFRSVDDFGCATWEWLLRWHGAFSIDEMAPGLRDWATDRVLLQ